jgi:hypothetical protein
MERNGVMAHKSRARKRQMKRMISTLKQRRKYGLLEKKEFDSLGKRTLLSL